MNIEVLGPRKSIIFDFGNFEIVISESVVTGWLIILGVLFLCLFLTKNLKKVPTGKRQVIAEYIVKTFSDMVEENMGAAFVRKYAPFVGTIFIYAIIGSLVSLIGLRSMTADISVTGTWALMVFVLVTYHKVNAHGVGGYLKSLINPLNLISEFSNPLSMAVRLFGNVAAGMVISMLVYSALGLVSTSLYILVGITGDSFIFNITQVGIPAALSIYFDLFSGVIQSYVFIMLTMSYIQLGREE